MTRTLQSREDQRKKKACIFSLALLKQARLKSTSPFYNSSEYKCVTWLYAILLTLFLNITNSLVHVIFTEVKHVRLEEFCFKKSKKVKQQGETDIGFHVKSLHSALHSVH